MKTVAELIATVPQVGRLEWIGVSSQSHSTIQVLDHATVTAERGLDADYHAKGRRPSDRQVTLIQAEHLPAIASLANCPEVSPELLRRNLVISGINLLLFKDRQFWVGEVLLMGTGLCDPCSRMEEALGPGGYNAMRGHGGITTRVLQGGVIRVGDAVRMA